jgi:hypothetical protein
MHGKQGPDMTLSCIAVKRSPPLRGPGPLLHSADGLLWTVQGQGVTLSFFDYIRLRRMAQTSRLGSPSHSLSLLLGDACTTPVCTG